VPQQLQLLLTPFHFPLGTMASVSTRTSVWDGCSVGCLCVGTRPPAVGKCIGLVLLPGSEAVHDGGHDAAKWDGDRYVELGEKALCVRV
jgi:hypothetical protein